MIFTFKDHVFLVAGGIHPVYWSYTIHDSNSAQGIYIYMYESYSFNAYFFASEDISFIEVTFKYL